MSQKAHLNGETKYRYLGYQLEMGQQRKKAPPEKSPKIFMQNSISVKAAMRRQQNNKNKVAAVFRGTFHS